MTNERINRVKVFDCIKSVQTFQLPLTDKTIDNMKFQANIASIIFLIIFQLFCASGYSVSSNFDGNGSTVVSE